MAEVGAQLPNTITILSSESDPFPQQNPRYHDNDDPSLLTTLGEEIVRIISPVSACMFLVVLLVKVLNSSSSDSSLPIGTIAYSESPSDSTWSKFIGALANSLAFVAVLTALSFLLVLLFYFRCTRFLKIYMAFSSFVALGILGGQIAVLLLADFSVPLDLLTFSLAVLNFAAVGTVAVFIGSRGVPIVLTQGYLVLISVLVAYWFTLLPEWTSWALLLAMAVYDLAAVLLPGGPLRLLVELAISRDEEIPALVYEARPVEYNEQDMYTGTAGRRVWRVRGDMPPPVSGHDGLILGSPIDSAAESSRTTLSVLIDQEARLGLSSEGSHTAAEESTSHSLAPLTATPINPSELTTPLVNRPHIGNELDDGGILDGIGLGMSGAIKLGLGDFIFYSVLVGRAAMYDFMTVYACYLAVIAGLGVTLLLLAFYQKALPALPVSVFLGVVFYFLTRALLEVFVVECSTNLVMF